jgi:transcriptional regulator with XRE-family HTH domain
MSRPAADPSSINEIAKRLTRTRMALGYTTTKMCELMGSSSYGSAWTNYEMGRRRISLDHALALWRACGLTLDWIYCGDISRLPEYLQRALQQGSRSGNPTTTSRMC